VKVVGRLRTPEGKVVRIGLAEKRDDEPKDGRRATPAPESILAPEPVAGPQDSERDPWWFLRALSQEAFEKHF